jgi:hypothetical protein
MLSASLRLNHKYPLEYNDLLAHQQNPVFKKDGIANKV